MVYQFRSGSRVSGDAQVIGDRLDAIREKNGGRLEPPAVVDDASRPRSPIHHHFEWDDTEAAVQHRLWQARMLIASVSVVMDGSEDAEPVRAFVHISEERGPGAYRAVADVLTDDTMRERLFAELRKAIRGLKRDYSAYKDCAEILAQVEALIA